jgi:putative sigma-54 modulation protein
MPELTPGTLKALRINNCLILKSFNMKVNTQSVNFNADQKLVDFIQKRMDKLEVYYDRVISSDVYLKVQKTSNKENKIVEVKVHVPGDDFIVKKQCKSFEEGIGMATDSLGRLLLKRKEKLRAHI